MVEVNKNNKILIMELTVGILRKVIQDLPDDVILATLEIGNDKFQAFTHLKRLILLKDITKNQEYLTINQMGSHFTGEGEQKDLSYTGNHWDDSNTDNEIVFNEKV